MFLSAIVNKSLFMIQLTFELSDIQKLTSKWLFFQLICILLFEYQEANTKHWSGPRDMFVYVFGHLFRSLKIYFLKIHHSFSKTFSESWENYLHVTVCRCKNNKKKQETLHLICVAQLAIVFWSVISREFIVSFSMF